jgi:hypothetical protein
MQVYHLCFLRGWRAKFGVDINRKNAGYFYLKYCPNLKNEGKRYITFLSGMLVEAW